MWKQLNCNNLVMFTTIILILVDLLHFVTGFGIVFGNVDASDKCAYIWVYLLFASIVSVCNFLNKIYLFYNLWKNKYISININISIHLLCAFIMTLWGVIIYYVAEGKCFDVYQLNYNLIWHYYFITLWYFIVEICIVPLLLLTIYMIGYCYCCIHNIKSNKNIDKNIYIRFNPLEKDLKDFTENII